MDIKKITYSLLIASLVFLSSCTSNQYKNTFQSIAPTQRSCFDFPYEVDPPPTEERDLAVIAKLKNKLECNWFSYQVDGIAVEGFYLKAKNINAEKLPVVIFNHGGNARSINRLKYIVGTALPLAKKGYLVVGSLYRGARITTAPNPNELADEFGGADVKDVLALLPIIDSMPYADTKRIGLYGVSRGVIMAYRAAAQSKRFSALISVGGPVDLVAASQQRPEMEKFVLSKFIPNYWQNKDLELKKRSAIFWAEKLPRSMPILLIHGTKDDRVELSQSIAMAKKLDAVNIPHKLLLLEGANHGITTMPYRATATTEIIQWLDLYVKNSPTKP